MKKILVTSGIIALVSGILLPTTAHAAGNQPPVDWGDGKGTTSDTISIDLNADQYQFWMSNKGSSSDTSPEEQERDKAPGSQTDRSGNPTGGSGGPAVVSGFANALGKQNAEAADVAAHGVGKVTNTNTGTVDTFTCYNQTGTTKDEDGETVVWYSQTLIKEGREQGWAATDESNDLCPSEINVEYLEGANPKVGKLVAAAYEKPVFSAEAQGIHSGDKLPQSDPRCANVNQLNKDAKKTHITTVPSGSDLGNLDSDHISRTSSFQDGCIYHMDGFSGKTSDITRSVGMGGMKCVRGYSFGQQFDNTLTSPDGETHAQTMAGTPWDESAGTMDHVERSPYGQNESWDNCSDASYQFKIDKESMGGKEILPSDRLGRYRNKIFVYEDDPTISIESFDDSGAPADVTIVDNDYTTKVIPVELQQACQTGFTMEDGKTTFTPEDAARYDLKATAMTHYEVGANIPGRYVDVKMTGPLNTSSDTWERTPLSYTMTDCLMQPGVVKTEAAYVCGTSENKNDANTAGNAIAVTTGYFDANNLTPEKAITDPNENPPTLQQDGEKNVISFDRGLTINRSGEPTFLKYNTPQVQTKADREVGEPSNLRVDDSLALIERYATGEKDLNTGTPFVNTPDSLDLVDHNGNFKSDLVNKDQVSKFQPTKDGTPYVSPKQGGNTAGSVPEDKATPTVDFFTRPQNLDFRFHDSKTGNVIDSPMSISGTQSKVSDMYTDIQEESAKGLSSKDSTVNLGKLRVAPSPVSISTLDNTYNAYDLPESRLADGVSSIWQSAEGQPQKIAIATSIVGEFPMEIMSLDKVSADGFGHVNFDFGQVTKSIPGQLLCVSQPLNVQTLKSVG